jgi:hypothetical protein
VLGSRDDAAGGVDAAGGQVSLKPAYRVDVDEEIELRPILESLAARPPLDVKPSRVCGLLTGGYGQEAAFRVVVGGQAPSGVLGSAGINRHEGGDVRALR